MEVFSVGATVFLYPFSMNSGYQLHYGGNRKKDNFCKNPKQDVLFCTCQYRVYEKINIQNTGGTEYAE
jgi:hypothetical protein